MPLRLKPAAEQVVVIVGASSGIGRQTALRFAERGARLVLSSRDEIALSTLLDEVRARGATDALVVVADTSDAAQVEEIGRRAVETFGRIDTWAHVAGVDMWATFEETTPEEFRRVIEVNLLGPAYGAMTALPALRRAGRGALIVVSSLEADVPLPYQSAYAASKHGVNGLVRALRMELEAEDAPISVTQVRPASIDTPLFGVARTRLGVQPRPVPPVYDPDVVARLIVHAAEHPMKDVFAGGAGLVMSFMERLTPRLNEAIVARIARPAQRSDIPKPDGSIDNLDAPVIGVDAVDGGAGGRAFSIATRYQMLPAPARLAVVVGVIGSAAMLLRGATRSGDDG